MNAVPGSSNDAAELQYFNSKNWETIANQTLTDNAAEEPYQKYPLTPGANEELRIDTGNSKTTTIDGDEVTIAVSNFQDSSTHEVDVEIGGTTKTYQVNDVVDIYPGDEIYIRDIFQIGPSSAAVYFREIDPVNLNRKQKQYRVKYIDDDSSDHYTAPFYLTNQNEISIYPQKFEVNGSTLDFNTVPGTAGGSSVDGTFYNPSDHEFGLLGVGAAQDNGESFYSYNENLNSYIKKNTYFGIVDSIENTFNELLGNTTAANTYEYSFKPPAYGTSDSPHVAFRMVDFTKSGNYKQIWLNNETSYVFPSPTTGYSYTTAVYDYGIDSANDAPQIGSITADSTDEAGTVNIGNLDGGTVKEFRVSIQDESSRVSNRLIVRNKYDDRVMYNHSATSTETSNGLRYYNWNTTIGRSNYLELNESGQYSYELTADDGDKTASKTGTFTVPWGDLRVEWVTPSSWPFSMLDNETQQMTWKVGCSGGPECVNQNESSTFYPDPKPVDPVLGGLS